VYYLHGGEVGFFANIVGRICSVGSAIGAAFLGGMMVLIVAVVVVRPFGEVIVGSYELIELLIVVTVAFALGYTALKKAHTVVDILVSRFPKRLQAIVAVFTCFLSFGIWGWITWAGLDIALKKGIMERTDLLLVSYLPFRLVWVFGLFLISIIFLIEMLNALKQAVSR
jgi:TRAP-type C4-dicarboxylate transport system permease small subunit